MWSFSQLIVCYAMMLRDESVFHSAQHTSPHRETEANNKNLTVLQGLNLLVHPRKVPHIASDCASLCIESPYVGKAWKSQKVPKMKPKFEEALSSLLCIEKNDRR